MIIHHVHIALPRNRNCDENIFIKSTIHQGITLSGASSAGFGVALPGGVADSTRLLARALGCNSTDSEEIITCLQTKDPDDINYWGFVLVVGFK